MACQTTLLDAAVGTRLQRFGLQLGKPSASWNVQNPAIVRKVHQLYLDAGAQILLTNTFGARSNAEFKGAVDCIQSLNGKYQIAGSIGPRSSLKGAEILVQAVDFFIIETYSDLAEAKNTFLDLEKLHKPIALSFAWVFYDEDFYLHTGLLLDQVIKEIRSWPLLAFGANCNLGTRLMAKLGVQLAEKSPVDIWIKSNAGQPKLQNGEYVYSQQPQEFAKELSSLFGVARYLGGCCGTNEDHLRALHELSAAAGGLRSPD